MSTPAPISTDALNGTSGHACDGVHLSRKVYIETSPPPRIVRADSAAEPLEACVQVKTLFLFGDILHESLMSA